MRLREYVPYYKRLLHLAAPVVLAQAGQLTTQFADTAMVGNYGGEDAVPLAAVSLGSSLFLLIYLAAMGFAMSITPLVGEHYARNDRRMVGHLFQNGIAYSLIIGVISTIIALALRPFIGVLGVWMSSSGDDVTTVTDMALPYYDMLVWSIMPLMIFLAVKQFLEGIGNTKVAMWITLVGNFLNIVLNWVFIFGKCGFEAMGAEGAGLATLIARVVQMLLIIAHFFLSRRLRIYRSFFSSESLSRKLMRRCVAIGSASTIVVSHIYGSKDRKHLRPMVTATYHLGLLWATLMAFMFVLLRTELVGIFTDNVEVMAISANLLILIAIYQFSDSVQGLSISMLRGLQDVKIIMPIVLCSYLILNIPLGALLAYKFDMQCYGLAIGLIIGLSSAAVMTFVRVRRDVRKFEQGRSKK